MNKLFESIDNVKSFTLKEDVIIQDDNLENYRDDILEVAEKLGIDFSKFTIEEFITGVRIELEHGTVDPNTDVTGNSLELTAKIALAHLNEFSDYYNEEYGLPAWERGLAEKHSKDNKDEEKA